MGDAIIEMNVEHSTSDIELYVGNKSNLKLLLARISLITRFFVFVVVIDIQAFEFLLRTILRRGKDFAFYLDALSEVDQ